MEDKIPEQLMEIILKYSAFERDEIDLDTSINLDYRSGMSHYDAILFFDDLYNLYCIDFPKDFNVTKYFYMEGMEIPNFLKRIFKMPINKISNDKNITIKHIIKIISEGKWIEP